MRVPPAVKCFVSGLLLALGLLVMLPSALVMLPESAARHVLRAFFASAAGMFVVHHVFLGHQHGHSHGGSADLESCSFDHAQAVKRAFRRPVAGSPTHCPRVGMPLPPERPPSAWENAVSLLSRAAPYTIHAFIDGAMIGTAQSPMVLLSLALPVTLCAIQDVGTIILNLAANGASSGATLVTTACFAAGFPLGAALTGALVSPPGASPGSVAGGGLEQLRACAGGVFAYMALFELAPPLPNGRAATLRYSLAFLGGVAFILLSEAAEDWALAAVFARGAAAPSPSTVAGGVVGSTPPSVPAGVWHRVARGPM